MKGKFITFSPIAPLTTTTTNNKLYRRYFYIVCTTFMPYRHYSIAIIGQLLFRDTYTTPNIIAIARGDGSIIIYCHHIKIESYHHRYRYVVFFFIYYYIWSVEQKKKAKFRLLKRHTYTFMCSVRSAFTRRRHSSSTRDRRRRNNN